MLGRATWRERWEGHIPFPDSRDEDNRDEKNRDEKNGKGRDGAAVGSKGRRRGGEG